MGFSPRFTVTLDRRATTATIGWFCGLKFVMSAGNSPNHNHPNSAEFREVSLEKFSFEAKVTPELDLFLPLIEKAANLLKRKLLNGSEEGDLLSW